MANEMILKTNDAKFLFPNYEEIDAFRRKTGPDRSGPLFTLDRRVPIV